MHTSSRRELLLPTTGDDAGVVRALLELERDAVRIYAAAADRLSDPTARTARRVLEQEQAHVRGLERSLRRLGHNPPGGTDVGVPGLERALSEGAGAFARFAAGHEERVVAAYLQAVGRLRRPGLRSPVASILANEAQHLALFREALGRNPVPRAFETGVSVH
jgi:rubrerythrin